MSKYKLAIIMRTDLEMGKGKMCVQSGHASILAFKNSMKYEGEGPSALYTINENFRNWFDEGQFKAVVKCPDYPQIGQYNALTHLMESANQLGLPVVEVRDFGKTQVDPNTLTCIAIGPALCEGVDKVTGGLSLL